MTCENRIFSGHFSTETVKQFYSFPNQFFYQERSLKCIEGANMVRKIREFLHFIAQVRITESMIAIIKIVDSDND